MEENQGQCRPHSIRVWRGFRSVGYLHNRAGFDKAIREIFVPQTAQQMTPLGLRAYFPALMPQTTLGSAEESANANSPQPLPDEIALVAYSSQQAYTDATRDNVAGRAYGLLHVAAFNFSDEALPSSTSAFPQAWCKNWELDKPYYIVDKETDWQQNITEVIALQVPAGLPAEQFRERVAECIEQWLASTPAEINGSIFCANEHYVLYWENRHAAAAENSLVPLLQEILGCVYVKSQARAVTVPPAFERNDHGVEMDVGELLDLRVSR